VAARKSRPQRQQGTRRKGSIGGRRFGSGKRQHWCAACGNGPRRFASSSPTSELRRRIATGSVRGLIVRPTHRKTTPARGLTPLTQKGEAAPGHHARRGEDDSGAPKGRTNEVPRLAHATPIAAPLGVGDAFGPSGANPEDAVRAQHKRVEWRLGAEGGVSEVRAPRSRVGGHQGCSLTTSRLQRFGERYPVLVGSSVGRRKALQSGGNGEGESAAASHHPDRREAARRRQGCSSYEKGINTFRLVATPDRKVGIEPIEGILGREVVSSNRQAANRSWRVR
jgi:hypothetical protein